MPADEITVKVGQIWADNDKRAGERQVQVLSVDETHATVRQYHPRDIAFGTTNRLTQIRLDRFRPTSTGYRLVSDAPEGVSTDER